MANHALRCCAGDTYSDPASQCDNTGPCNLPVPQFPTVHLPLSSSQVPFNQVHVLIFWVMFALLFLDVVCIIFVINLYVGQNTVKMAGAALIQALFTPRATSRQFFTATVPTFMGYKKFDVSGKME